MKALLILSALAVASPALAEPKPEPTPAELKAQNAELKAANVQLATLVQVLRKQREQALDEVAQLAMQLNAPRKGP